MIRIALVFFFSFTGSFALFAQSTLSKYGNDFLSVGAGARALRMGSAHATLAKDVTSSYWNVAGLAYSTNPEFIYMHSGRFGGIVGYDYGTLSYPLKTKKGVIGISFFRQGVDNIANTLNAWDADRGENGGPKEDPESYITRFSAVDVAILISYSKMYNNRISVGASAKIINQRLDPFANAWGYSLDVGALIKTKFANLGVSIQDVTTMQKMWTVNDNEFEGFKEVFEDSIPSGKNEYVLPSIRFGIGKQFSISDFDFATAFDLNLLFEDQQAYYFNPQRMSIEPHVGVEVT